MEESVKVGWLKIGASELVVIAGIIAGIAGALLAKNYYGIICYYTFDII